MTRMPCICGVAQRFSSGTLGKVIVGIRLMIDEAGPPTM